MQVSGHRINQVLATYALCWVLDSGSQSSQ